MLDNFTDTFLTMNEYREVPLPFERHAVQHNEYPTWFVDKVVAHVVIDAFQEAPHDGETREFIRTDDCMAFLNHLHINATRDTIRAWIRNGCKGQIGG